MFLFGAEFSKLTATPKPTSLRLVIPNRGSDKRRVNMVSDRNNSVTTQRGHSSARWPH
jgi:hypothetical protein